MYNVLFVQSLHIERTSNNTWQLWLRDAVLFWLAASSWGAAFTSFTFLYTLLYNLSEAEEPFFFFFR